MRRIFAILFFIISTGSILLSQRTRQEPPPLKERLFYGGNFGLQLGSITDIEVSPVIGLWILPRLNVAVGPDYRYYKIGSIKTQIYGGKAYTEFILLRNINSVIPIGANTNIILHLEDELLSLENAFFIPYTRGRFNQNTLLGGGGLSQAIGRRSSLNIVALWTLNEGDKYNLYGNPEIRFSFIF